MNVFKPEDYGNVGADIDSTAAVQAAVDAAVAFGGGIVQCDGEYGILSAVDEFGRSLERYANQYRMRYGIHVPASNIYFRGTGALTLLGLPPASEHNVAAYTLLIFGVLSQGVTPYVSLAWLQHVGIEGGLTVSAADSIPTADLITMSSSMSGNVGFSKCEHFTVDGLVCRNGFGHTGILTTHVGTRNGIICNADLEGRLVNGANGSFSSPASSGIELDGGQYIHVHDCKIKNIGNGVGGNANADNGISPYAITIANNEITDFSGAAVFVTGSTMNVYNNVARTRTGATFMQTVSARRQESGTPITFTEYPAIGDSVIGNTFEYTGLAPKGGTFFYAQNAASGTPVENSNHVIQRNTIIKANTFIRANSTATTGLVAQGNVTNTVANVFTNGADVNASYIQTVSAV